MSCALTQSYSLGCRTGFGGLECVYFADFDTIGTITRSGGIVTDIPYVYFLKYALQKNTSSFTEKAEFRIEFGSTINTQNLNVIINGLDVTLRNEFLIMMRKRMLIAILDRKGNYWLMGETGGAYVENLEMTPGTTATDRSGYSISFKAVEKELAPLINSSIFTGNGSSGSSMIDFADPDFSNTDFY